MPRRGAARCGMPPHMTQPQHRCGPARRGDHGVASSVWRAKRDYGVQVCVIATCCGVRRGGARGGHILRARRAACHRCARRCACSDGGVRARVYPGHRTRVVAATRPQAPAREVKIGEQTTFGPPRRLSVWRRLRRSLHRTHHPPSQQQKDIQLSRKAANKPPLAHKMRESIEEM